MDILLLGGTGAIGSHLSSILADRGYTIVVTSRIRDGKNGTIEYRKGNAKEIDFLKSVLQEKHWDAIVDFMVYSVEEFSERVKLLLDSTSQYIFLSTSRVYDSSQEFITEDSPRLLDSLVDTEYLSSDEYALAKARQENILLTSHKKNWVIIRPYITYSEYRLQLGTLEKENWLYRALKGRTIVFSKDMCKKFTTLTYGFDVASGIANLINNSNTLGEAFHITSEYACQWEEILNIYLDVLENKLGYRPKVLLQDLDDFLEWNPGKYQIIYDRLFDRKFDCKKISRFINIKEFVQVQEGLRNCLNEFLENPKFQNINWYFEALQDRYANEKTPLNEIKGLKYKLIYIVFRYILIKNNIR